MSNIFFSILCIEYDLIYSLSKKFFSCLDVRHQVPRLFSRPTLSVFLASAKCHELLFQLSRETSYLNMAGIRSGTCAIRAIIQRLRLVLGSLHVAPSSGKLAPDI